MKYWITYERDHVRRHHGISSYANHLYNLLSTVGAFLMKEYQIKVTVRNNLLLAAIESAGYKSQSDFAKEIGESPSSINSLFAMRTCPSNEHGEFSPVSNKIMEALGACPTDLWTLEQLTMRLTNNTAFKEINRQELIAILGKNDPDLIEFESVEDEFSFTEQKEKIMEMINTLEPKQKKIMILRFGLDGTDPHTLDELAKIFGLTRERIRQIEAKSLRKMRHPSRCNILIKTDNYDSAQIHNSEKDIVNIKKNLINAQKIIKEGVLI